MKRIDEDWRRALVEDLSAHMKQEAQANISFEHRRGFLKTLIASMVAGASVGIIRGDGRNEPPECTLCDTVNNTCTTVDCMSRDDVCTTDDNSGQGCSTNSCPGFNECENDVCYVTDECKAYDECTVRDSCGSDTCSTAANTCSARNECNHPNSCGGGSAAASNTCGQLNLCVANNSCIGNSCEPNICITDNHCQLGNSCRPDECLTGDKPRVILQTD